MYLFEIYKKYTFEDLISLSNNARCEDEKKFYEKLIELNKECSQDKKNL